MPDVLVDSDVLLDVLTQDPRWYVRSSARLSALADANVLVCFVRYRRAGGARKSPLPDFYIGAHAAVRGLSLPTCDAAPYRTYFPRLDLLVP